VMHFWAEASLFAIFTGKRFIADSHFVSRRVCDLVDAAGERNAAQQQVLDPRAVLHSLGLDRQSQGYPMPASHQAAATERQAITTRRFGGPLLEELTPVRAIVRAK
jgi:hypothetical protein